MPAGTACQVTGSVSGRTDILVVGKDPGFSKVSKARARTQCRLLSLHDLRNGLENNMLEDAGRYAAYATTREIAIVVPESWSHASLTSELPLTRCALTRVTTTYEQQ